MLTRQPNSYEMQQAPAAPAREEISVTEILTFLRWYWPLIAATVLAALSIGLIYVLTARPIYTAQTQILMETSITDNMTRSMSESMIALDTPQIESQIALLRSEQIAQKVAAKLAEFRKGAKASQEASAPQSSWLRKLIFGENVDAKPAEPSKEDKKRALRAGLGEIQGGMDVKRIGISYALELSFRSSDPATAALVANAIGDTYVQDKLEVRAAAAREGGRWLEARIDELRHLMNEAALDVQEFKARRDYRILDRSAVDNPESNEQAAEKPRPEQTTLEELESRAQTYRKIYESYLQAYTETLQRQSFPGAAARVISRAEVPTSRSSPRTYFTLGVAGVLGAMFGFGLALAHMSFDQTVRSARQVHRKLGVPYLGEAYVSHLHAGLPIVRRIENLLGVRRGPDPILTFVKSKPLSRAAQDLKDTALALKEVALARNLSVIGVVGTSNDLNAAAVASNLAIIYARAGLSTLLIDTHTSEPQIITAIASPRPARSLSEITDQSADIRSALTQADAVSPFVLALRKPNDGGDLNADVVSRLGDLMDQYRAAFDLVLVHIPPAGSSARAPELTKAVDAIVVVSKMRQTQIAELTDVANSLQIAGKSVLGVINASMV